MRGARASSEIRVQIPAIARVIANTIRILRNWASVKVSDVPDKDWSFTSSDMEVSLIVLDHRTGKLAGSAGASGWFDRYSGQALILR
jgi:hypothetical protein